MQKLKNESILFQIKNGYVTKMAWPPSDLTNKDNELWF